MDLILYNPKSKNSKASVQTHKLVKKYKKEGIPFRLKSILKIDDLKEYLSSRKDFEKVILLGGDGTIHQLVNNLFDYDLKQNIFIKKNGSGNDFLRTLKDQDKRPQYIMKNTLDEKDSHYFINGMGIGLDGLIIDYVDKAKSKGKLTYFLNTLRAMLEYVPEAIDVEIDGEELHFDKCFLITVNNGKFIGGGMEITPNACINDEYLDVIIVHSVSKWFILAVFSTIYLGLHTKFKKFVYYKKCKHIKAKFTSPQITQSDGERTDNITIIDVKSTGKTIHLQSY